MGALDESVRSAIEVMDDLGVVCVGFSEKVLLILSPSYIHIYIYMFQVRIYRQLARISPF